MRATTNMLEFARGARPWMLLLSALGFLQGIAIIGLAVIAALGGAIIPETGSPLVPYLTGGLLMALACLVLYPMSRLWAAGTGLGQFLDTSSPAALAAALRQHKKFWRFWAILTIIQILIAMIVTVAILMGAITTIPELSS